MKPSKKIIISVHDISPLFKKELKIIFNRLNNLKIKKEAFVVINWLGKYPLEKDKYLIAKLKKEFTPDQINFHGYTHYSLEKSPLEKILFGENYAYIGEFKKLSQKKILNHIKTSLTIFKKIFKKNPLVFIPSRWENSKALLNASKKLGIQYSEDPTHLINLNNNIKKFSFAICFDYGDNKILNYLSRIISKIFILFSRIFNLPIRFSIHPNDVKNGNLEFEFKLLKKLINDGWKPINTKEFWENEKI